MSRRERPVDRIAPDFADRWNADSPEEALAKAERAPSTTPEETKKRCKYCSSTRLRPKPGGVDNCAHRIDTDYKCNNCGDPVDDPAPPADRAPDFDFVDDRETPFIWASKADLCDPDERGESHELRGLTETTEIELTLRLYKPWSDAGPSYRELAQLLPYSREWVGSRVREWKRGEHRDLVPGPWPTVARPSVEASTDRVEAE